MKTREPSFGKEDPKTANEQERVDAMRLIAKIARANGMFVLLSGETLKLCNPEIARLVLIPYYRFGKQAPMISLN